MQYIVEILVMSTLTTCIASSCLHCLSCLCIALKYAPGCWQFMPVTCFACIFLTVTPFGGFFICNLISFPCALRLCYWLLLLTNLKCGLRQNSTNSFNYRVALSDMH